MVSYAKTFIVFLLCVLALVFGMLLHSRLLIIEEKIDAANEMLVLIRTNGIIGERVR